MDLENYPNVLTTLVKRLRPLLAGGPHQFIYEQPGAFTANAGGLRAYNRFGQTFTTLEVHLSVSAEVAGSAVIVDVNVNGTTVFTDQGNRPQIAVGQFTGASVAIDVVAFAHDDYFTVDVDQGAGTDLAVVILVG
jgi:hypothetical protein